MSNRIMIVLAGCALAGCAGLTPITSVPAIGRVDGLALADIQRPGSETADWWFRAGSIAAHQRAVGPPRARNIIMFVGDGMSLTTVAAARILEGQRRGEPGEENRLSFEDFPATALSRTYSTDRQTSDSASTMTAMIAGAKTRSGLISVGQASPRGDCRASKPEALATALELAETAGLATGVVTTTRITHATPAAAYAHSPDRDWEGDADLTAAAREAGCPDIASQLVDFSFGDGIEVAMGGGRSNFLPAGAADPEYAEYPGRRLDGRDLVEEWKLRHADGRYVWNAGQFGALDLASTRRLLGLFEPDHLNYENERAADRGGEPSLAEMTRAAITILKKNPKGFLLIVEGGRIDHAHHAGNAFRALNDTIAFSDAVRVAANETSDADTLILVTADHSHTLSFAGYSQRGSPILGKVMGSNSEDASTGLANDALGLPYTTLSYANGPGYVGATDRQPEGPKRFPHGVSGALPANGRPQLRDVDTEHPDYLQESAMPLGSQTHGGDDVGIWARGPGSGAVRGSLEQNVIFHLLVQAQPDLVQLLCAMGDCEQGVPVRRPNYDSLKSVPRPGQAR